VADLLERLDRERQRPALQRRSVAVCDPARQREPRLGIETLRCAFERFLGLAAASDSTAGYATS
jgi:hypothetical protein